MAKHIFRKVQIVGVIKRLSYDYMPPGSNIKAL